GLATAFVVDEPGASVPRQRLDRDYLRRFVKADSRCYLCGPPPMMRAVSEALHDLGVADAQIVKEEF
ncbi:MAG: flavodoxin reductase, partial [Dehalococcoidia bacterium]|nr:flavodoxin reductase [Dehalococcoidia bacterium]